MKRNLLSLLLCGAVCAALAQSPETEQKTPEGYVFTDVATVRTTPVKDQHRSGTCWCFSTMTFLEDEIIKAGGPELHLSEMWIVRHSFMDKAEKYVRLHGSLNFAEGGAAHDVTEGIRKHGIVPFDVYPGLNYGSEKPDFHEISCVLKAYLDAVIAAAESSKRPLSTAWKRGFEAILDEYFGPVPERFDYNGKTVYVLHNLLPMQVTVDLSGLGDLVLSGWLTDEVTLSGGTLTMAPMSSAVLRAQ